MKKYSRADEASLPVFYNHRQARLYFKNKHGDNFFMVDSDILEGEKIYFYHLVLNQQDYKKGINQLRSSGSVSGLEFMNSYQKIEIWENGNIHMIH